MGKIINLRHKRKQKIRAEKEKRVGDNRVQFGRARTERQLTGAQNELDAKRLDGKRQQQQSNSETVTVDFAPANDEPK